MDDMDDSLFEGMVLFDPTSSSSSQLPVDDDKKQDDAVEVPNHREISQQPPQSPTPAATTTAGALFEPLDENLFSDLTLVEPQYQDDVSSSLDPPLSPSSSSSRSTIDVPTTTFASPSQSSTSTSISDSRGVVPPARSLSSQISSTRKKKRAGLRIGYGRASQVHDSSIDVDDTQPQIRLPSPSPSPSPSLSHSSSLRSVVAEEKTEPEEEKPQTVSDSGIGSVSDVSEATNSQIEEQIEVNAPQEEEITEDQIKENSMEFRYEQIKKQIADKLNSAQQAVASVSSKRKDFIKKRRKAEEDLNLASAKHKEMEKELEAAVESEDFETAERVSDSLQSAEKKKELLLVALRDAESDCDSIDSKMQEALELQIVTEEECAVLLKSFSVDADDDANTVISNAKTKTLQEMENWFSLSEALEVKKIEIEIESHVLSGARQVLDDSIDQIVKEDKEESNLLYTKKNTLSQELEELLSLVKQKEAEIAENDSNIEKIEKKIADVTSTFQEAQSSIHSKTNILETNLSQIASDNESLSRKKKEIDDFLVQEESKGSKIKELGEISSKEAEMYQEIVTLRKSLLNFISKSREEKSRLALNEQKLFEDVQIFKQDISSVRSSLQDLSSRKSGIQQEIESSKQRLVFIEKRVPELESEKKVAATARNFKEAARIANEVKTLNLEKESLQIQIEESVFEVKKIEDEISDSLERLKEKEEKILLMEKELEMVRYKRLVLVGNNARGERMAAMEFGDVEEGEILLKEADVADLEAKKIEGNCKENDNSETKPFISMELVSSFDKKQLAELVESLKIVES